VIAFIFRNMPVGVRAGIASMSQIDKSLDEASLTLRRQHAHHRPQGADAAPAARHPRRPGLQLRHAP
jgi:hypothetical protein